MKMIIDISVLVSINSFVGWCLMFCLVGVFNIFVVFLFWIFFVWVLMIFGFEFVLVDIFYIDFFLVLVFVFGIGYWCIGIDLVCNWVIIEMGIVGKFLVVFVGYQYFFMGSISFLFVLLVFVDLVWVLFFWCYLYIIFVLKYVSGE